MRLYESPRYYDIAFGWDIAKEADFYEACFKRYGGGQVQRILEPGCGTGRLLFELARRGYTVEGLDLSPQMVEFVRQKARTSGLEVKATQADMAEFEVGQAFEGALCLIGTFRYLLTDGQVKAHFQCMGRALRPGGLYLIDFDLLGDPQGYKVGTQDEWEMEREGVTVHVKWRYASAPDLARGRILEESVVTVNEKGKRFRITDGSELRLWPLVEFAVL